MKSFGDSVRKLLPVFLLTLACASFSEAQAPAATFSVSPTSLSFGIPTGSPASAPGSVIVSVTNGSVSFTGASTSAPFSIESNSCTTTVTAPNSCTVNVIFTSTSTTLQSGTLTITTAENGTISVPLTGAFGAIKLFDETTVATSVNGSSFDNPHIIANQPLNLSCSTTPITAKLSGTPDGSGYVLVDNYLTLAVGNEAVGNGSPAGNVCAGGVTDSFNGAVQQDCFSQAYRTAASNHTSLGDNTDA